MKYCNHCGTQLVDEAIVCTNCGCAVETRSAQTETSTLKTVAKIFMLIGCVLSAFLYLVPLCWTIPMTVYYWKAVKNNTPVSTAFKICSLIFVNVVAGILMLCDHSDDKKVA